MSNSVPCDNEIVHIIDISKVIEMRIYPTVNGAIGRELFCALSGMSPNRLSRLLQRKPDLKASKSRRVMLTEAILKEEPVKGVYLGAPHSMMSPPCGLILKPEDFVPGDSYYYIASGSAGEIINGVMLFSGDKWIDAASCFAIYECDSPDAVRLCTPYIGSIITYAAARPKSDD